MPSSSSAAPEVTGTAAGGAPVPVRERFVPLTAAQKADIEATEVKDRIQRSRSAAAAAAKFQFIADDQAPEELREASTRSGTLKSCSVLSSLVWSLILVLLSRNKAHY